MRRLIATLLLSASLLMLSSPISLATSPHIKDSSGFDVFEVLSIDEETDPNGNSFDLTQDIINEAEQEGTSPVGAVLLRAINILTLLIGTFAFVMIIIGGIMFATAGGDESKIDRGKALLVQSIVGLVVAFLSYFIVTFILSFFY